MATQKIEVDLSQWGPILKPYLPIALQGLSIVIGALVTVGAALQKLDNELKEGKDAVPETKAGGPMDTIQPSSADPRPVIPTRRPDW
jgi:hypothetical protein